MVGGVRSILSVLFAMVDQDTQGKNIVIKNTIYVQYYLLTFFAFWTYILHVVLLSALQMQPLFST